MAVTPLITSCSLLYELYRINKHSCFRLYQPKGFTHQSQGNLLSHGGRTGFRVKNGANFTFSAVPTTFFLKKNCAFDFIYTFAAHIFRITYSSNYRYSIIYLKI
ncbi:hypothetical protein EVA_09438 [gut metagenome]|uniref:Uncharacterized protein n=1 Tax=gut metagenome TaxID=749906 RepID=J9G5D4_9ZZZZ